MPHSVLRDALFRKMIVRLPVLLALISCACFLLTPGSSIASGRRARISVNIEEVTTRKRSLDALVFRGFSKTCEQEREAIGNEDMTDEEALDKLMTGYDNQGRRLLSNFPPGYPDEIAVPFVAICEEDDEPSRQQYRRTDGVMAIVEAQVRHLPPDWFSTITNVTIPYPHVYLKNLRVDEGMRRQGVGAALCSVVTEFARRFPDVTCLVLHVYADNIGAVRMYEREGYVWYDDLTMVKML